MTINRTLVLIALAAATALADNSGTQSLTPGQSFSFDKGSIVTSGGDILFSGTSINLQGSAKGFNFGPGGTTAYNTLSANTLPLISYNATSISPLAATQVFAVLTNAPNYAAVMITAVSASSVTLQYKTFGTTTGGGGNVPSITVVENNYGNVGPGQANYGIAPGALFFVQGTALAPAPATTVQSSASPGLQTTLENVTVTVSVGGSTQLCPLYYLSPTQIDAVLPGNMPSGTGTVVVNNNGALSSPAPIVVVQSAFGVINYSGTLAATYDANNFLITSTNAANPGQTIVVWGSGVGYDPKDDDRVFPQGQNNLTNIAMQAYVGGLPATISYRGRSQYPGVDQIVLTIPNGVTPGCWVSLAIVSGTPAVVSNGTTIPVAASGKVCTEPNSIYSPSNIQQFLGKSTIRTGGLLMGQTTSLAAGNGTTVQNFLGGTFQSATIAGYTSVIGGNLVSIGSCLVINPNFSTTVSNTTPLDAGPAINVSGPQGSLALTKLSLGGQQIYSASSVPANFIPASGGPFTYDNAGGGADVGHFNTTANFPANFTWTNPSVVSPIDRTQGVTVTWSGGTPGVTVQINGSASATVNGQLVSGSFTCQAPLSAGTFTVPQPVLLALPAGSGQLSLTDQGAYQTFSATGLDFGFVSATAAVSENVIYK
jgi:uncharacterized protein (TIGR03437 family)